MAGKFNQKRNALKGKQGSQNEGDAGGEGDENDGGDHPAARGNERSESGDGDQRQQQGNDRQDDGDQGGDGDKGKSKDDAPPAWFTKYADDQSKRWTDLDKRFKPAQSQQQQQRQQQQPEKDVYAQAAELMFVDPARAFKMVAEHSRQGTEANLTGQYTREQAVTGMFNNLYNKYDYLKPADQVVRQVIAKNIDKWAELDLADDKTYETIAEAVDKELLRLAQAANKGKGIDRSNTFESGRGGSNGGKQEPKPATIGSVLGDRRRTRETAGKRSATH